jgi:hypothetical protein
MSNEQSDGDRVPELPATETPDEVAERVKGGATDSAGRPPQQTPVPRPIGTPRTVEPCW